MKREPMRKHYDFRLTEQKNYSKPFYHTCEVEYKACIALDAQSSIGQIIDEMDKVKEIFKIAQKAIKDQRYFELEITESVYDFDENDNFIRGNFDCWVSVPWYEQDDAGGIYLKPDTRYTNENRDMYLSSVKDLFKDLKFTLG